MRNCPISLETEVHVGEQWAAGSIGDWEWGMMGFDRHVEESGLQTASQTLPHSLTAEGDKYEILGGLGS